jgi:hypothetical protein
MKSLLALTLCGIAAAPIGARAQQRVDYPAAGISLVPPAGWRAASMAQVQANRERTRLSDPEFQRALTTRSALPLFVFMKYEEPHAGVNPTVQVTLRQNLQGTPIQLLTGALGTMRRGFPDLELLEPVTSTTVPGLPAAKARLAYTLRTDTISARVLTRMWLVPRGSLMFLIGLAGPESGRDVSEQEFAEVFASLEIQQ